MDEKPQWSEEAKELTRKFVRNEMPAAMKSIYGRFALMGFLGGKVVLFDRRESGRKDYYDNVEELLGDGWVVD
jgi:hypothetical protein